MFNSESGRETEFKFYFDYRLVMTLENYAILGVLQDSYAKAQVLIVCHNKKLFTLLFYNDSAEYHASMFGYFNFA